MDFNGGVHHYLAYLILRHLGVFASWRDTGFPNPNNLRERRGPAANGLRIQSEPNGWFPSAPRKGSAIC
jgi:hypothetical protein